MTKEIFDKFAALMEGVNNFDYDYNEGHNWYWINYWFLQQRPFSITITGNISSRVPAAVSSMAKYLNTATLRLLNAVQAAVVSAGNRYKCTDG